MDGDVCDNQGEPISSQLPAEAGDHTATTTLPSVLSTMQNAPRSTYSLSSMWLPSMSGNLGHDDSRPSFSRQYGNPAEFDDRHVTRRRPRVESRSDHLRKRNIIVARRIKQQVSILDGLQMGIDKDVIKSEVARLDQAMQELDEVTTHIIDITGDEDEGNLLRQTMEEFEALAVRAKRRVYDLISHSNSGSSCGRSSGHSSRSGSQRKVRQWICQSGSEHRSSPASSLHPAGETSYPEMLQTTDKLRSALTWRLGVVEDLLRDSDNDALVPEIEHLELLHHELVMTTDQALAALPDRHMQHVEMAKLEALESQVSQLKERVYLHLADRRNKERDRTRHSTDLSHRRSLYENILSDVSRGVSSGMPIVSSSGTVQHGPRNVISTLPTSPSLSMSHNSTFDIPCTNSKENQARPQSVASSRAVLANPTASPSGTPRMSLLDTVTTQQQQHQPQQQRQQQQQQQQSQQQQQLYSVSHSCSSDRLSFPPSRSVSFYPPPQRTSSVPSVEESASREPQHLGDLGQVIIDFAKLQSAPQPTLDTFSGDPLDYTYFQMAFKDVVESCVPDERGRLNRLLTYTTGPAKELVMTCVYCNDDDCFTKAMDLLHQEYGNKLNIARAYIKQLKEQPSVKGSDPEAWKKLHRFLLKCKTFKATGQLRELDRPDIISTIITKLDTQFQDRWTASAEKIERTQEREVNFEDLLEFVHVQTSLASHPTYSRQALKNFKGLVTRTKLTCYICKADVSHTTEGCPVLQLLSLDERYKKVYQEKLSFGCLQPIPADHSGKTCTRKLTCNTCWDDHPTLLHKEPPTPVPITENLDRMEQPTRPTLQEEPPAPISISTEKICSVSDGEGHVSMCVILVRVHHGDDPVNVKETYALLDLDCTGCFATQSLLSEVAPDRLNGASILVETMNGSLHRDTKSVSGLVVRCSEKHAQKHGSRNVKLPTTYGVDQLPFSKEDMPSPDALKRWEYLKDVIKLLPTYDEKIPFGLMIGGNCVKALEPYEYVRSVGDGPFAYRTLLGWCVVGASSSNSGRAQKCCYTQVRLNVQDVATGKPMAHYFRPEANIIDTAISDALQSMYRTEFSERFSEGKALSAEDRQFLKIMKEGVRMESGKYVAPVPFKDPNVVLPSNKGAAVHRLLSHRPRMQRDSKYNREYSGNMDKLIKQRAEQCKSSDKDPHFFIPHFGVQQKAKAMRVVFDCAAKFEGRSINDELLQGPDLVNLLVGVLIRYRKEVVAYSADLEAMFHQIQIPPEQRRFF